MLPFADVVRSGRKSLLTALLGCDVPVEWFGLPAVQAVIDIRWQVCDAQHGSTNAFS